MWEVEAFCFSYFDAGVDGTDEKDVGENDEDADVKAKHKCCSVEEEKKTLN